MRIIAIIPARGGSKGIPGKNLKLLAGKPLIAWSIDHAVNSPSISEVYVSSDDDEILSLTLAHKAIPVKRPIEFALDHSPSEDALLHAFNSINAPATVDYIVFLQPTSPLRRSNDLEQALKIILETKADTLLSVTPHLDHFLWRRNSSGQMESINYDFKNRKNRQRIEETYLENGSFYICKPALLLENRNRLGGKIEIYRMPKLYSFQIDTLEDFEICETLLKMIQKKE